MAKSPKSKLRIRQSEMAQFRLTKLIIAFEKQSQLAFKMVARGMITDVLGVLRGERLAKSDDDVKRGWTGEVPRIEIDTAKLIGPILSKYVDALRYVMLGKAAGKAAEKAAKEIGVPKSITPGLIQASYLASIDSQREHYADVTGKVAPNMPGELMKDSLESIYQQSIKYVEQLAEQLKQSMLSTVDKAAASQNMRNLTSAHQAVHEDGTEAASEATEPIAIKELREELEGSAESLENKWDLMTKANVSQSVAVGTHQSMVEIFGSDSPNVKVAWVEFEDEKVCDFCRRASKNPDGAYKLYDMKDFEPAGYNFGKKKAQWKLCVPPGHHRCRCQLVFIPPGFQITKMGTLEKAK